MATTAAKGSDPGTYPRLPPTHSTSAAKLTAPKSQSNQGSTFTSRTCASVPHLRPFAI